MQDDQVTLAWTSSNICNKEFEVQGFVISNDQAIAALPSHVIKAGSSNSTQINSSLFSTPDVYFRLVAVDEGGSVCSDATSQETYFKFEGNTYPLVKLSWTNVLELLGCMNKIHCFSGNSQMKCNISK